MGEPVPTVVLVTGEPGSGKTTLGTALGRAMRVPFIARDDVRGGLYFTRGAWREQPGVVPTSDEAIETFLLTIEHLASLGVSCVAEFVVRRSRPADLVRLTAAADVVVVRTRCSEAPARRVERHANDRLLQRPAVLEALGFASPEAHLAAVDQRMADLTADMRTDFDLPIIDVSTDDGYDPGLDRIVEFVTS